MGTGVILLPLLLHMPENDLGLYWVLIGLQALVPLMDLGFLTSIERAVGYAMGGATDLRSEGVTARGDGGGKPNYELLAKLLTVTRSLYRTLTLVVLVGLGAWGTFAVGFRVSETSSPLHSWIAWGITLVACAYEMYAGWWSVYLRALNRVLLYTKILVVAFLFKFLLSSALLLADAGLLAVPIASLVSSLLSRSMARRKCVEYLAGNANAPVDKADARAILKTLWPNSWRTGLHYISGYLISSANTFICMAFFGLGTNASFGLTLLIVVICQSMSSVWVQVKWPLISQLRARNELPDLRSIFARRMWLAHGTFLALAGIALMFHEPLLKRLGSGKSVLPSPWLWLLILNGWLEMRCTLWSTLLATSNRTPFLVPSLLTSAASLAITFGLIGGTDIGVGALVLGPLIAGVAFNYWYWPQVAAHSASSSWIRMMFDSRNIRPGS